MKNIKKYMMLIPVLASFGCVDASYESRGQDDSYSMYDYQCQKHEIEQEAKRLKEADEKRTLGQRMNPYDPARYRELKEAQRIEKERQKGAYDPSEYAQKKAEREAARREREEAMFGNFDDAIEETSSQRFARLWNEEQAGLIENYAGRK